MTVIMLQRCILLLFLSSSIIGHCAALTIYPAVVINASYMRNRVNLFCLNGTKQYKAEWLNPNLQVLSNKTSNVYKIDFTKHVSPGSYWCRNQHNHSIMAESKMILTNDLTVIGEEQIAVRNNNHDVVLNCSTDTSVQQNSNIAWARVLYYPSFVITGSSKYTINPFELTIHNADRDDMGKYACYANDTYTVYKLIQISAVQWPPEPMSGQNRNIVMVNAGEEVVLNCTVSASPDPVYSWSFPDSCSSCPNTSNDSVLIFTANTTSGGDYICVAENQHGRLSILFVIVMSEDCSVTKVDGSINVNQRKKRVRLQLSPEDDSRFTYMCKLDNRNFTDCKSSMVWKRVEKGKHAITVRAFCNGNQVARQKFKFKIK